MMKTFQFQKLHNIGSQIKNQNNELFLCLAGSFLVIFWLKKKEE